MDIKIEKFTVGFLSTNCYIIESDGELAVVDPGDDVDLILSKIGGRKEKVKYILLTHAHSDHTSALEALMKELPRTMVVVSREEFDFVNAQEAPDSTFGLVFPGLPKDRMRLVSEGDKIMLGNIYIDVLITPGHTTGSTCYLVDGNLFSGDTLFYHSHGMTNFPGGSKSDMDKSLARIGGLDNNIKVFPGHLRETTIGMEKEYGLL